MPQLEPAVISDEAVDEYSTQAARGHDSCFRPVV